MSNFSTVASALHVLSAVVWVGGMFFAYMVLRPSLGFLEPPQRLTLWNHVFGKFFVWVWIAVVVLPATGYGQVYMDFGDFAAAGLHVRIMHIMGLVMIALFLFLFFVTFRAYRQAVAAADWPRAGRLLVVIRRIVATNLVLGLVTSAVGTSGRFWG